MNPTTRIAGCVGIALLISSGISHAQDWTDHLYLHTDIGPAFAQSAPTEFRNVPTPSTPFTSFSVHGHLKAVTEIRADLSVGYQVTKPFAIEAEAGAIWNPSDEPYNALYQIPVMLNGIYQFHLSDSWRPYLGAGAGAVFSATHLILFHDSDWSPGYQAKAGIKYVLSHHVDIDLGYRFLGVSQYEYRSRRGLNVLDLKVNDLFIHSAELSLTWKF